MDHALATVVTTRDQLRALLEESLLRAPPQEPPRLVLAEKLLHSWVFLPLPGGSVLRAGAIRNAATTMIETPDQDAPTLRRALPVVQ